MKFKAAWGYVGLPGWFVNAANYQGQTYLASTRLLFSVSSSGHPSSHLFQWDRTEHLLNSSVLKAHWRTPQTIDYRAFINLPHICLLKIWSSRCTFKNLWILSHLLPQADCWTPSKCFCSLLNWSSYYYFLQKKGSMARRLCSFLKWTKNSVLSVSVFGF